MALAFRSAEVVNHRLWKIPGLAEGGGLGTCENMKDATKTMRNGHLNVNSSPPLDLDVTPLIGREVQRLLMGIVGCTPAMLRTWRKELKCLDQALMCKCHLGEVIIWRLLLSIVFPNGRFSTTTHRWHRHRCLDISAWFLATSNRCYLNAIPILQIESSLSLSKWQWQVQSAGFKLSVCWHWNCGKNAKLVNQIFD